ncbi:uncharacterized protein [Clytia hemisphaerica]|uniref:Uncharacterized protein n=1 Tax=Clytia hemisphaerica TaxID=252671 RepID=A0A7M5WIW0_9CNID|eukprot:TCONS_00061116-protein
MVVLSVEFLEATNTPIEHRPKHQQQHFMDTSQKIAGITLLIFIIFVSLGIAQCFFINVHSCFHINGACPGVWAPFVYISLPYLMIRGYERNSLAKHGMIGVFVCFPISIITFVFSAADAICTEKNTDPLARILSQTVAVINSIFAVPLFFAFVGIIGYLLFSLAPAKCCLQYDGESENQKLNNGGVLLYQRYDGFDIGEDGMAVEV